MPSEFETFAAEFAAPSLAEQFGERDEHGELAATEYQQPGGGKPFALIGVVISRMQVTDEVQDEHGTNVRDQIEDVVELHIPRQQMALRNLYTPQTKGKFRLPSCPGPRFTLIEVISLTDAIATVRCSRKHITDVQSNHIEDR